MSHLSLFDDEYVETNDGGMEFPATEEGDFVFEDSDFDYNTDDQVQHELEVTEDCLSDVSATVLWKHVVKGKKCGNSHGGSHVFKCKHCKNIYHGTYTRVYAHLMGHKKGESKGIGYCSAVKADKSLQRLIKGQVERAESLPNVAPLKKSKLNVNSCMVLHLPPSPSSFKSRLGKTLQTQEWEDVDSKVIRCLCSNGIPFNVLRSPYWKEMVSAISKAPGYKSPSYERARTTLLDDEKNRVEKSLDDFKEKWPQYGISIVSNGWTDVKNQPLLNIFASNQFGSMFLYAHDFSMVQESGKNISEYLLEAIEKVGPYHVVQLITDNVANCKLAGEVVGKAYPHIFWTPCIVHTLNLLFKDLTRVLPWFERTYTSCKHIMKYIRAHSQAFEIFQSYSKLEMLKVTTTRFALHYITLKRLIDVRETIITLVLSDQWEGWARLPNLDKKVKLSGGDVKAEVMSEKFWEAIQLALSITKPIYKMIRRADREGPLIEDVYEGMNNMLGEIKDNMKGQEDIFMIVEEKILSRWKQMNIPLQCLAHALSPKYYDEVYLQAPASGGRKRCPPDQDNAVFDGAMAAIFKMHSNVDEADLIRVQFMSFIEKKGRFSSSTAKRDARNPKINVLEWWKFHGGDTKELRNMAFKVLGQSIRASSLEKSWTTYSFIHNVKQNRVNSSRADKLVYIHSNLRLLSRFNSNYNYGQHRKWDINPELPLVDESASKWDDLCLMGLDDDESTPKSLLTKNLH